MFINPIRSFILLVIFASTTLLASSEISQSLKEKKFYPMGEKIYNKKCNNLDTHAYKSYDSLFDAIQQEKLCGSLNENYSQALALYIWDVKNKKNHQHKNIEVTKENKCQVCGMYLHYYPNWATQIDYPKGETYKFDGAKCMFKFYFNNKEGITDVLIKDYYSLKTIDARKAYFVIGSDVLGPMGNELIGFKDKKSATTFSLEHKGKKVLQFNEITEKLVRSIE